MSVRTRTLLRCRGEGIRQHEDIIEVVRREIQADSAAEALAETASQLTGADVVAGHGRGTIQEVPSRLDGEGCTEVGYTGRATSDVDENRDSARRADDLESIIEKPGG